ncbi:MAG: DNA-binding protein [Promethearchaeota archaeon CR_4]|nr:MAG: DNA-binding protein [Candidatus Lokiarchaeota archaeon CR_4]
MGTILKKRFKTRMKEKRELLGMSQEDLAKKVSVSRQTINYIENGTKTPDLTKAFEIARALKTDVGELFVHIPLLQDADKMGEWNRSELRALLMDLGLEPQIAGDDGHMDWDAFESLTLANALELARRLKVSPEEIFEFNFEEKKKLELLQG